MACTHIVTTKPCPYSLAHTRNVIITQLHQPYLSSDPRVAGSLLLLLLCSVHGHALVVGHLPVVLVVAVVLVAWGQLLLLLHGVLWSSDSAVLLLVTVHLSIDGLAGKNLEAGKIITGAVPKLSKTTAVSRDVPIYTTI